MAVKFLLDTNVVIYLLGGRLRHALPQGDFGVSVITEIELLSYPALAPDDEAAARGFLDAVARHPLTDSIRDRTIALRRQHRLKLPDALIAATALDTGATLLSNDQQLLVVPSLMVQAVELA
jgi:predicted nucleic acid-binding protein